ncbi:MAG: fructose-specific PTS transporter subunit EIIC [Clostridium sp.]|uniref:fructose-specific PTS transporter subunit EIIC n=1 Tax=Clostridium sp. TaxID=1506 RepID=UPI00290CF54D|nr:fructose-specific PTS transporter subunit EIIC [Clostridium sp.]MDU5109797.1 fructose-specific PTS transporter subunit EIIC [Clostridium sp.]
MAVTKRERGKKQSHKEIIKKAIFNGLSYIIPLVAGCGLLMTLGMIIHMLTGNDLTTYGVDVSNWYDMSQLTTIPLLFKAIGLWGLWLVPSFLGAFIAQSIAGKPGVAPGFLIGMLAYYMNGGFIGGIIAGIIAGYVANFIKEKVKLGQNWMGLVSFVIIPLSTLVVGILAYKYGVGIIIEFIMNQLTNLLSIMGERPELKILLGLVIGAMTCTDFGGPINKTAILFGFGVYTANKVPLTIAHLTCFVPMAGLFIAYLINKKHFSNSGKQNAINNMILCIAGIGENTIPFAMAKPKIIIPASMIGGAVSGALVAIFNIVITPTVGFWMALPFVPIENGIRGLLLYILAYTVGAIIIALLITIGIKREVRKTNQETIFFEESDSLLSF